MTRYPGRLERAYNESMDYERQLKKQLDWALQWLAFYKAQAEMKYGTESVTSVEQLREQSKKGGMPV